VQRVADQVLYSASGLVHFLECEHLTTLDLLNLYSSLDYLLCGAATIAPDRGIFLDRTYRMHPDVCRFVSDAIYEGRLEADPVTHRRRLVLSGSAHPALHPTGVRFLAVEHEAYSQKSEEEAEVVRELVESLLAQQYCDSDGLVHPITLADILVVAPYNLQVNLLAKRLPNGARVGTVDKFQGQEAEVVIVSMATSNDETMPRSKEFLYSRNRLNVAISRARCLAVVVASPGLLQVRCGTVEEMGLVNLMCWVAENC